MPVDAWSKYPGYVIDLVPLRGTGRARVEGVLVAESDRCLLVRESDHRDVLYFPRDALTVPVLDSEHTTICPFKGEASHGSLSVKDGRLDDVLWWYPSPRPEVSGLAGYVSFYADRVEVTGVRPVHGCRRVDLRASHLGHRRRPGRAHGRGAGGRRALHRPDLPEPADRHLLRSWVAPAAPHGGRGRPAARGRHRRGGQEPAGPTGDLRPRRLPQERLVRRARRPRGRRPATRRHPVRLRHPGGAGRLPARQRTGDDRRRRRGPHRPPCADARRPPAGGVPAPRLQGARPPAPGRRRRLLPAARTRWATGALRVDALRQRCRHRRRSTRRSSPRPRRTTRSTHRCDRTRTSPRSTPTARSRLVR